MRACGCAGMRLLRLDGSALNLLSLQTEWALLIGEGLQRHAGH